MEEALEISRFTPTVLTGLGFETIANFRQVRENLGDKLKWHAETHSKESMSNPLKFIKRLDSDGHMIAYADIGQGQTYLVDVGASSLRATASRSTDFTFFLKVVAPVFAAMLSDLARDRVDFLGMRLDFSLQVKQGTQISDLERAWPFGWRAQIPASLLVKSVETQAISVTYTDTSELVHRLAGSLRIGNPNRIDISIDTRREQITPSLSSQIISQFYSDVHKYVTNLVTDPLATFFKNSDPEG